MESDVKRTWFVFTISLVLFLIRNSSILVLLPIHLLQFPLIFCHLLHLLCLLLPKHLIFSFLSHSHSGSLTHTLSPHITKWVNNIEGVTSKTISLQSFISRKSKGKPLRLFLFFLVVFILVSFPASSRNHSLQTSCNDVEHIYTFKKKKTFKSRTVNRISSVGNAREALEIM